MITSHQQLSVTVCVCVLFYSMIQTFIHLFSHSLFSIQIQNRMNKKRSDNYKHATLTHNIGREEERKHKIFLSWIFVGGARATFFGCFCYYYCWIKVHFEKTTHAIPSIYIITSVYDLIEPIFSVFFLKRFHWFLTSISMLYGFYLDRESRTSRITEPQTADWYVCLRDAGSN